MSDLSDAFLIRAQESLLGAESEFREGRYNNAANRAYYACFHAAISALARADIRPTGLKAEWAHAFVQSQFNGVLIGRRKRYGPELREVIAKVRRIREQADYDNVPVSHSQAQRALGQSRRFVETIARSGETR